MSKTLGITLMVVLVLALAGGLFFAGAMAARFFGFGRTAAPSYGWNNSYGPGIMGRSGGFGIIGGRGGYGMMGGYGSNNTNSPALTVDQARAAAQKYLAALNNSDLAVAEVMIFSNNAYVAVKETSTGRGAFELLVDPVSQVAYPEHGPNMMWNLKYGGLNHQYMMGGRGYGMMGGGYGGGMMGNWGNQSWNPPDASAAMPVTAAQAVQYAQKYLDTNVAGAVAASDPLQFYGYYTLDFSRNGKIIGMLSVNGYSGQVFPHTWHGTFVEEAQ